MCLEPGDSPHMELQHPLLTVQGIIGEGRKELGSFQGRRQVRLEKLSGGSDNLPAMQGTGVRSLGQEDPLKKGMAYPPSILAWRISWTEEPRRT